MSNTITQTKRPGNDNDQIIPYYTLRILIGAAGILLPVLLVIGKLIAEKSLRLEYSISDYYDNSTAGDILVGVLFSLAFFLVSYKGYAPIDSIAANFGCAFALGVALFPTTSKIAFVHYSHFVFALLLFSVFIFFSIYLFRKSSPHPTKQKRNRNKVYLICGIIMSLCIVSIALCETFRVDSNLHLVFWFESVALASFGFSWITKAEVVFQDDIKRKNVRTKVLQMTD